MTKERLQALETEIQAELNALAVKENYIHQPVTDGVVDIDRYLDSSPKMLWILKEPWEDLDPGEVGEGWSITEYFRKGEIKDVATFRRVACVAYAVFNQFQLYSHFRGQINTPSFWHCLRNIAYINISKFPGQSTSNMANLKRLYRKNRNILSKQVTTLEPDVIIGGYTLFLFEEFLGLKNGDYVSGGSASYCSKEGRLYIHAYHPGQWSMADEKDYVDDIVAIIKNHSPVLPPLESSIVNHQS